MESTTNGKDCQYCGQVMLEGADCECEDAARVRKFQQAEEEIDGIFKLPEMKGDVPEEVRRAETERHRELTAMLKRLAGMVCREELDKATIQISQRVQAIIFMGKSGVKVRRVYKAVVEAEAIEG